MKYSAKWPQYRDWWNRMEVLPGHEHEFEAVAAGLLKNKARYQPIEEATGVPWYMIAVLHKREGDANFGTYLGNGQSLQHVTTIVPKGRGPFRTFFDGAVDALKVDGLSSVIDWRLEKCLYYCELFNGAGYDMRGLPSPYIWGGTNIQRKGKYVSDGKFEPYEMDTQPGVAPLLAALEKADDTIQFSRES